jgi:hypothetical protein
MKTEENSAQRRESARKIWAEIRAERVPAPCTNKLVQIEEKINGKF